jgi:hypothetical protein
VFAKLKTALRRAQHRTLNGLWDGIGQLLDLFEPEECRRYIQHCGYTGSG